LKNNQVTEAHESVEKEELIDAFYVIVQSENDHESEKNSNY
jgi:hypothetical protein